MTEAQRKIPVMIPMLGEEEALRRAGESPDQSVFAATGADDEDLHSPEGSPTRRIDLRATR